MSSKQDCSESYLRNATQTIQFLKNDACSSKEISANNVKIITSPGGQFNCSSQILLSAKEDLNWEHKYYTGQLIAMHILGKVMAYGIRSTTLNTSNIRIRYKESNSQGLIEGLEGMVQDLAFAHIPDIILLATIDECGTLSVYMVTDSTSRDSIDHDLILQIKHDTKPDPHVNHRVIWVPYMPESGDKEQSAKNPSSNAWMLFVSIGVKVKLYHVTAVRGKYGNGPLEENKIIEGKLTIDEHTKPIVDASFSPDGTALATACLDGTVKFFQVYMLQTVPVQCLHTWTPHDNKPLSSIFFIDNHKNHNPDSQFWKFVITGCDQNTELRVWSCIDWSCIQTVRFVNPDSLTGRMSWKAVMNLSATHLLLSDVHNKLLFALRIRVDPRESCAYIDSASEFVLPYPLLSFCIVDSVAGYFKSGSFEVNEGENTDKLVELCNNDDDDTQEITHISMFIVQPKSLMECNVRFDVPAKSNQELLLSSLLLASAKKVDEKENDTTSLSRDITCFDKLTNSIKQDEISLLDLMTPQEFSKSPAKKDDTVEESSVNKTDSGSATDVVSTFPRDILISGGSSPSREFQEILSFQEETTVTRLEDLMSSLPSKKKYFDETTATDLVDIESPNTEKVLVLEEEFNSLHVNELPHIPLLPEVLKPREDAANEASSSAEVRYPSPSLRPSGEPNELIEIRAVWESMQRMQVKMSSVLSIAQEQQKLIGGLREEINTLQSSHSKIDFEPLFLKAVGPPLLLLEEKIAQRNLKERERQENWLASIPQAIGNLFATKLNEIISSEVKRNIIPVIIAEVNHFNQKFHLLMLQNLSATDSLLKENITKLMQNLSADISNVVRSSVRNTCRETLINYVVPRCDKVLENIYVQCQYSFSTGIQEVFAQLSKELKKSKHQIKRGMETLAHVESFHRDVKVKLIESIQQDLNTQLGKSFNTLQDHLVQQLRDILRQNFNREFQGQESVIEDSVLPADRPRAATPANINVEYPTVIRSHLLQLINNGHVNCAFQHALAAADLNLVVFTCQQSDPNEIFAPNTLNQPVLLSLVQQLSVDLDKDTEVKCRYLREALTSIDITDPVTKEHLPGVLENCYKLVTIFISSFPKSKFLRDVRVLLMMCQAMTLELEK